MGTSSVSFASGKLADGTYGFGVEAQRDPRLRSLETTVRIAFDNAAPAAEIHEPDDGFEPKDGKVMVSGVAVEGVKVSVGDTAIPLDAQYRFRGGARLAGRALHRHPHRPPDPGCTLLPSQDWRHVNQTAPDLVGRTVLGRYRVVRAIGRGGMGVIYLARSEGAAGFVKPFVIKQAAPEISGDTMIAQLAREARIMSNLRHPGIVSVIDFAAEGGSHLLVLDYVQGYNLGQWRKFVQHSGRDFPAELAIHVVERVLDALDYAHRLTRSDGEPLANVHRDVSPGNVLLDVEGHVKLADFGVARMSTDHTEASDDKMIKGKISYMAPELFEHVSPTPSSDVYACAVMLHELLVGRNEFKADNVPQTAIRVMQHVPSFVSAMRSDVSAELDGVLQRALAKSPGERFANARELADALNRLRTVSPEQAGRQLAIAVREDFNDPHMAEFLGVDDPTTLERAWRDLSVIGDGPTLPLPLTAFESERAGLRRRPLPGPGVAVRPHRGSGARGALAEGTIAALVVGRSRARGIARGRGRAGARAPLAARAGRAGASDRGRQPGQRRQRNERESSRPPARRVSPCRLKRRERRRPPGPRRRSRRRPPPPRGPATATVRTTEARRPSLASWLAGRRDCQVFRDARSGRLGRAGAVGALRGRRERARHLGARAAGGPRGDAARPVY